ncbi:MAG: rod shape-determining protein MreC [Deltaproteobacteria bacterium]|nr:rod shape-determining protein MreC [Deltaproteobacteria bacterium]
MAFSLNARARVATTSFFLFCVSLFLTAYSARNPEVAQYGFSLLAEVQRPFQLVNSSIDSNVSDLWDGYINLIGVQEENEQLRKRIAALETLNSTQLEFKHENERLRKLLGLAEQHKLTGVAANVIGYDPTVLTKTVIIDKGSTDGVEPEMPVLAGEGKEGQVVDGVVGQVVEAGFNSSRVLLITDPSSAVDALVQDSRVRGVVRGSATSNNCELLYVLREDPMHVGDRIITSGMDQVFPKGLLIGAVAKLEMRKTGMFQAIEVKPTVNFDKLESVFVVTARSGVQE